MKVVLVVDSISDINEKISLLKEKFGNDILYIVKGPFVEIFKTYGYPVNAVYNNKLSSVLHATLSKASIDDVVICHASIELNEELLNSFIAKIGSKEKVVNVIPKYSWIENSLHTIYNIYVRSLFKSKDSMASPKLQFLPALFVAELLNYSIANKMFEINSNLVKNLYVENNKVSKSLKPKPKFNKYNLIPIIIALMITFAFVFTLMLVNINYIIVLIFSTLYVLDAILGIVYMCFTYFNTRFLQ